MPSLIAQVSRTMVCPEKTWEELARARRGQQPQAKTWLCWSQELNNRDLSHMPSPLAVGGSAWGDNTETASSSDDRHGWLAGWLASCLAYSREVLADLLKWRGPARHSSSQVTGLATVAPLLGWGTDGTILLPPCTARPQWHLPPGTEIQPPQHFT